VLSHLFYTLTKDLKHLLCHVGEEVDNTTSMFPCLYDGCTLVFPSLKVLEDHVPTHLATHQLPCPVDGQYSLS
jgi:hypothetical protein